MDINKPGRSALKSYFVKNAVPTASNFSDLIEAAINQKDDGIAKPPGEPFSIQADGDDQSQKKAINLYRSFADPKPVWTLSLKGRSNPKDAASGQAGFTISDGDGNARLYIDEKTGNVGVNTVASASTAKLDVNGPARVVTNHNAAKDPDFGLNYGGSLVLKGNAPQIDFVDTDNNDWAIHVNANKMYFIRQPWEYSDLVLDGTGKVGIGTDAPGAKLDVRGVARVVANFNTAKDPDSGMTYGGSLVLKADAPQIDFVDTDHNDRAIHVNSNTMYFLRQPWTTDMVIDGSGNVGIGTDAPVNRLQIGGGNLHMDGNSIFMRQGPNDQYDVIRWDAGTDQIHMGGYVGVTLGDTNTAPGKVRPIVKIHPGGMAMVQGAFSGPSDGRDKTDVEELRYGLEEVLKLRPVSFNWKDRPNPRESMGLIAQEVEPIVSEVVYRDGDDPEGRLSLSYVDLIPVLINAIKELSGQVEELTRRAEPVGTA